METKYIRDFSSFLLSNELHNIELKPNHCRLAMICEEILFISVEKGLISLEFSGHRRKKRLYLLNSSDVNFFFSRTEYNLK